VVAGHDDELVVPLGDLVDVGGRKEGSVCPIGADRSDDPLDVLAGDRGRELLGHVPIAADDDMVRWGDPQCFLGEQTPQ
jgi:hypothetical protein